METLDSETNNANSLLGEDQPPVTEQVKQEGVQVAPGGETAEELTNQLAETDEEAGLELGDRILLLGGRYDKTRGRIYYIDDELIRLLPDGVSNLLVDIPIVNGAIDEELEMKEIVLLKKQANPAFVVQNDIRVGQIAETFTGAGIPVAKYIVGEVNEAKDSIQLVDEAGGTLEIEFAFRGVPRDENFAVIRVQEAPKPVEETENQVPAPEGEEEEEEFEILEEIEVPIFEEIKEIPTYERVYSNIVQKNDMLTDLIKGLNPAQQKNLRRIRDLRRVVENMAQLRDDITQESTTGKPLGVKQITYETLPDLLEKTQFPLAKQVLAVARSLYLDHTEDHIVKTLAGAGGSDLTSVADENIDLNYLQDAVIAGIEYLESRLSGGSQPVTLGIQISKPPPRWHTVWQGFYNTYFKVAPSNTTGEKFSATHDRDYFRAEIPSIDIPSENIKSAKPISGLPNLTDPSAGGFDTKEVITAEYISGIDFSYLRSIGPRLARFGEKNKLKAIEEADEAEIFAYVLFPLLFIRDLGDTRSGVLAIDSAHGATKPKTMRMILQEGKGVSDIPTSEGILAMSADGSTLGAIKISDWLKGQAIYGNGIGDLLPYLRSFGMSSAELTPDQKEVLDKKVMAYIANIRKFIKEIREKINESIENPPTVVSENLLSESSMADLFKYIQGEPLLLIALTEFKQRYPSYSENDIAQFAGLFNEYSDLLISVLGATAEGVERERRRVVRNQFLKKLWNALALNQKVEAAGEAPQPNPCAHVESLAEIRKVKDNDDRMKLMVKFLNQFRSEKKDHWVWCSVCNQHLLCEHEFLIIQEYLRPREKDLIHKELLLTFSGGDFHGNYMCKQCGQPISALEFDTNLEYDDQGRPMMGRSELVDKDAIAEEEIRIVLSVEREEEEKITFDSGAKTLIYKTIATLANLLGITPDREAYMKMINRIQIYLSKLPTLEQHNQYQKTLPAGRRTPYEEFSSRLLISACASALLIDVQTHIPDYVIRYTIQGCSKPEFTGYPRDTESSQDYLTGISYVSCAVSSVSSSEDPWSASKFRSILKDEDRLKLITRFVEKTTKEFADMTDVQQDIATKKQYLIETYGSAVTFGRPKDLIPEGFTPQQIVLAKEQKSTAEAPVIEAAASPDQKARAWILEAHKLARQYGTYLPGTVLSESSCCYNPMTDPEGFWKAQRGLPVLEKKEPPRGPRGSRLLVHMIPRRLSDVLGEPDTSIMYRLFLRVCFRGDRIGLQHEPGYLGKCPWCGFQFPEDPRLPPPQQRFSSDKGKQQKMDEEFSTAIVAKEQKETNALVEQGVEVSKESFNTLLQAVNSRYLVSPVFTAEIALGMENLRGLLTLDPPPFEGFQAVIAETIEKVSALSPSSEKAEIALAYGTLSQKAEQEFIPFIKQTLRADVKPARYQPFEELLNLQPQSLGETLRSYFLLPLQRALSEKDQKKYVELQTKGMRQAALEYAKRKMMIDLEKGGLQRRQTTYEELSEETIADIKALLEVHFDSIPRIKKIILEESSRALETDALPQETYIRVKIKELLTKLIVLVPVFVKLLRANILPGGSIGLTYIQRAIVAGIFAEFLDPDHLPSKVEGNVEPPERPITMKAEAPAQIFLICLEKVRREGLNLTPEQIRNTIAERNEKEKAKIIKDFDKMDKDGKKLELLKKKLGLGRWAKGGTKVIWQYDEAQYAFDKMERLEAGIQDFPAQGGPEDYAGDGGYDVVQTAEDDA